MPGHVGNVLAPLPQRRQHDGKHRNSIPKVLAETALGHHRRQVAVRGGHNPHVNVDGPLPAHAIQPAVLEDPQQADLGGQRQFAQFVQEQRAAVGPLEPAFARLDGRR